LLFANLRFVVSFSLITVTVLGYRKPTVQTAVLCSAVTKHMDDIMSLAVLFMVWGRHSEGPPIAKPNPNTNPNPIL